MKTKSFAKLLSVILTLAICATTVFGCLITVNAQNKPSYVVSQQQLVKGSKSGELDVTFTVDNGITYGFFTVNNQGDWYSQVTPSIKTATAVEGAFDASDFVFEVSKEDSDAVVSFTTKNEKLYTVVVITLNFTFTSDIQSDVEVSLSDLDFSDLYDNYSDFQGTNGMFKVGCTHEYAVNGTPVYTDDENNYAVYSDALCVLCGESKDSYQVVPVTKGSTINAVSWTGGHEKELTLLDPNAENSESNPFIISTPAQLYSLQNGNATYGGDVIDTAGKYFKVADGIDAFYINGGETVANLTSAEAVKAYFEASDGSKWWSNYSSPFKGHFDGNGVTIYGLRSDNGNPGLFPYINGDVSIKNVTVKNSYLISGSSADPFGAIVGVARSATTSLVMENCTVANNFLKFNNPAKDIGTGALAGYCYAGSINVNNCIVYGNIYDNSAYTGTNTFRTGLISYSSSNDFHVTNVISLGITPWTINASWAQCHIDTGSFVNIFTDADLNALLTYAPSQNTEANAIKYNINGNINPSDLLGANAMTKTQELTAANKAVRDANGWPFPGSNLDWNTAENPNGVWYVGKAGKYPTLLKGFTIGAAATTNPDWDLLGANIEYKNDGNYALNFHFVPAYENQDIELYVAKADTKDGFIKLDTYKTSPFASEFAGAKMFTIDTLSARDIDTKWVVTIITKSSDGGELVYGKTASISIGDVANAVINGDAYYNDNATAAQKAADINVAAALINYNVAVKDISSNTAPYVTSAYSGNPSLAEPMTGSGKQADPYIVRTADQFAAMARGYIVTEGLYFKVADDVDAFYLSGDEKIADFTTAEAVKKYLIEKDSRVWWQPTSSSVSEYFKGHFDGNGVTIYGLYTGSGEHGNAQGNSALFPKVSGSVSIKNVNLKNSYVEGMYASGLIANGTNAGLITIENCSVEDCYIKCTRPNSDYRSFGGVLIANTAQTAHVYNCIVVDNVTGYVRNNTTELMPVISASSNSSTDNGVTVTSDVKNIIAIGASVCGQGWYLFSIGDGFFKNVYTDSDLADLKAKNSNNTDATLAKFNVRSVNKEDLYGSKAMQTVKSLADSATGTGTDDFDWENVWCYGAEGELPMLAPRTNDDTAKKAVYWVTNTYDDDFIVHADQPGDGSEANPYIIYDAEDLASVAAARVVKTLGKTANDESGAYIKDTTGVYFKVADNIKAFYMAQDDPTYGSPDKWDTIEKVKAALSNKADVYKWWTGKDFNGCFDGNGATVYGLFADKERAALFHKVGTTATIKNITLANSYLSSTNAGFAGGLIGSTSTSAGSIVIENCGVINNYIHSAYNGNTYYGGAGAIVGNNYWGPKITINNCLVIGNDVGNDYAASLTTPGLVGFTSQGTISNTIVIGSNPYIIGDAANGQFGSIQRSAKAENYTNVYTDADISVAETLYGVDYADNQLKQLTTAQMKGEAAQENMGALLWDSVWYTGNRGEYPSLSPVEKIYMPADIQAEYNALVIDTLDNYAQSTANFGVYSTGLTLKTNPYMTFTFAFNGEYKRNENVVVTFKSNGNVIATVTAAEMTNNEDAGRYHLYRLKDIPVKALCSGIEVTASYNGTTYNLGTYSVEGFALQAERANRIDPCEYYSSRYEAAKALLFYSQMLAVRYGA